MAEADNDAVAVFAQSGLGASARSRCSAAFPVEWYPRVTCSRGGDSLWVLNAQGRGTGPNPRRQPTRPTRGSEDPTTVHARADQRLAELARRSAPVASWPRLSRRVAVSNGWDRTPAPATPAAVPARDLHRAREPHLRPGARRSAGGPTATRRSRSSRARSRPTRTRWPSASASSTASSSTREVSGDGHNWTTGRLCGGLRREDHPQQLLAIAAARYDYERPEPRPAARRRRERAVERLPVGPRARARASRCATTASSRAQDRGRPLGRQQAVACGAHRSRVSRLGPRHARHAQRRRAGSQEFRGQVAGDSLPALTHPVAAERPHVGRPDRQAPRRARTWPTTTWRSGVSIEALSHSRYWEQHRWSSCSRTTRRTVPTTSTRTARRCWSSRPTTAPGVVHRFANTTDVLATIDRILKLGAMSKIRPVRALRWPSASRPTPDAPGYRAILPEVSRSEVNADSTRAAAAVATARPEPGGPGQRPALQPRALARGHGPQRARPHPAPLATGVTASN